MIVGVELLARVWVLLILVMCISLRWVGKKE